MKKDFLEQLLDETPDAVIATTLEGQITYWNKGAERVFGYASIEAVDRFLIELTVPPDRVEEERRLLAQALSEGLAMTHESIRSRKDGSLLYVDISTKAVKDSDGGVKFMLFHEKDVTHLKALRDAKLIEDTDRERFEQALREKNLELANANQAKDRFLATMSHELRTPLNAIIGFTGTLLMKLPGPTNAEQDKQLRTIQTSARHLLSLINDLLDLAKIESGKVQVTLEPVRCAEVLEEVAAGLRPLAEQKGLQFEVSLAKHDLVVLADRRALSQILINLTNNAIKFTEKGSVRLDVLHHHSETGATATHIQVADTGIGVRPEDKMKLFQAFSRVNTEDARPSEGTGLGLHLSQKLAELIGGYITLESEYGRGSRFTLVLAKK